MVIIGSRCPLMVLLSFYVDSVRELEPIDNDGDSEDNDGDGYPMGQEKVWYSDWDSNVFTGLASSFPRVT